MEARYGLIRQVIKDDTFIEFLQCLGDNGGVVVDVFEDKIRHPSAIFYKVYWERFPVVNIYEPIPTYVAYVDTYFTNSRAYKRSYRIEVGGKIIPLGSVVVREG